ncbi:hypothetical protein [Nonomuraea sp. NPDC003201]
MQAGQVPIQDHHVVRGEVEPGRGGRRFSLDRAPSGRRRTIYLAGQATGAQVIEIVGPGTRWHEAGIVTDEGHLVSVGADPADPQPAQVNAIVSTYGLDDGDFAALRDRWAARWQANVKDPEVIP